MTFNFSKLVKIFLSSIFILIIFISIFFTPFYSQISIIPPQTSETQFSKIISPTSGLCWPLPGYTKISSPFGYRNAPTAGATNFHGGIDLPAPPGTNIISAISGKIISTSFMGSGRLYSRCSK